MGLYSCTATATGAQTVQVVISGGTASYYTNIVSAQEWAGAAPSSPFEGGAASFAVDSASASIATGSSVGAGDLVYSIFNCLSGICTPTAGQTPGGAIGTHQLDEYQIAPASGTWSNSWTWLNGSNSIAQAVVAIKPASTTVLASANLPIAVSATPVTIASISFYNATCGSGSPYNSGNPVGVVDSSTAGTAVGVACVTMTDGSTFDGTLTVTSQSQSGMLKVCNSAGSPTCTTGTSPTVGTPAPYPVQVASISGSDDGAQTIQVTATPGSGETGGTVAATLYISVTSPTSDPTANVLPPANDVYTNWYEGGVTAPAAIVTAQAAHTTLGQCGSTLTPVTTGSPLNDAPQIIAAIAAANPASCGYILLGPGTFHICSTDTSGSSACGAGGGQAVWLNKGITLRGTGNCTNATSPYCQTVVLNIDGTNPANGVNTFGGSSCVDVNACNNNNAWGIGVGHPDATWGYNGCEPNSLVSTNCSGSGVANLAADVAQGAMTVRVDQTSYFSVGMWVLIDEASGAYWQTNSMQAPDNLGQIWAGPDAFLNTSSPAEGRTIYQAHNPYQIYKDDYNIPGGVTPTNTVAQTCNWNLCDRPTSELHLISGIGAGPCPGVNCTLTFDTPLTISYHQSNGQAAHVYVPVTDGTSTYQPFTTYAGVENMTIAGTAGGGVNLSRCAYCWAKNVEVLLAKKGAFIFTYAARSQFDFDYANQNTDLCNSGGEYAMEFRNSATEDYIDNSIAVRWGKPMTARGGGAGSVVAYNLLDQSLYDNAVCGISSTWIEMGVNGSHAQGARHILFEGNRGANLDNDDTHGNANYHTYFRNWGTGYRYGSFVDQAAPSITIDDATNTPGGNGPLRAAGAMAYDYWMAYVGNVLGTASLSTAGNGWTYVNGHYGDGQDGPTIYKSGWLNWDPGPGDSNLNGSGTVYAFRHGNYDYVSAAVVWDSGTSDHTLPNSFYLCTSVSSCTAPAFFSAGSGYTWPWVTPTAGSQIQIGPSGCGGTCSDLPALARFQAGTPFVQP